MSRRRALLAGVLFLAACGGGSGNVGVYASVGSSPWGWGPCCYGGGMYGPPVVVAPPVGARPPGGAGGPGGPGAAPPRPVQPIARPPSAAPRPAAPRGGGGGGRRR
jgi:hypothetical protein